MVIADAHFPAARLAGGMQVDLPGLSTPRVLRAICSILPLDDAPGLDLMASPDPDLLEVQRAESKQEKWSLSQILKVKWARKLLYIGIVLGIADQLTGINTVTA